MKNHIKTGLIVLVFVAVIGTGVPVFAQSYYGYAQNYNYTPIVQTISIPQNQLMYIPSSVMQYMPSYSMPSSYNMPSNNYTQPSYNYTQPSYNTPSYTYPSYGNNSQQYYPNQYYGNQYTSTNTDPNNYPRVWNSYPEYDDSYAWFSNYYQDYPDTYGVYTGNTDLFGTPLCDWSSGYKGYDCSYDPAQWVYDPYTGTWY